MPEHRILRLMNVDDEKATTTIKLAILLRTKTTDAKCTKQVWHDEAEVDFH